jgi:Domain of unknown function DUF29
MKTRLEFIDEMSKSERRELENRLYALIEHILKIKHVGGLVASDNLRGWSRTIRNQRREVLDLLMEHPGLKPDLNGELIDHTYASVVVDLKKEYPLATFPRARQLSMDEIVGVEIMAAL